MKNTSTDINKMIEALLHIQQFKDFEKDQLMEILAPSNYQIRKYAKKEIIHLQNEKCMYMDIIVKGKVTVQNVDKNGNVLTIETFTEGDLIGMNLVFANTNLYPMMITASLPTTILMVDRETILELCRRSENFMIGLISSISDKSVILTDKINSISRKTIRGAILEYLRYTQSLQGSHVIELTLSKKELAERLGVARSSLGRELIKMRNEGLVEYDAHSITILKQ